MAESTLAGCVWGLLASSAQRSCSSSSPSVGGKPGLFLDGERGVLVGVLCAEVGLLFGLAPRLGSFFWTTLKLEPGGPVVGSGVIWVGSHKDAAPAGKEVGLRGVEETLTEGDCMSTLLPSASSSITLAPLSILSAKLSFIANSMSLSVSSLLFCSSGISAQGSSSLNLFSLFSLSSFSI